MFTRLLLSLLLLLFYSVPGAQAAPQPNDHAALSGLKTGRAIFDVRITELDKLVFHLNLVQDAFDGMVAQRVKPRMVVAFRGPGLGLLATESPDEVVLEQIRTLRRKGVRFEACAYAMRVAEVDSTKLLSEIILVANVLNSHIGYQNKGYALVVLN